MLPASSAHVFWLFGLSGAGKSTLAALLAADLKARGIAVLSLDGDVMRGGLSRGLGFSDADRAENLRRSAEVARIALMSDLCVIAAFITPLETHREMVANIIGPDRISPVLIDASLNDPEKALAMINVFSRSTLAAPPSVLGPGTWVYGTGMALGRRVLASNPHVNVFHRGFVACDRYANGEAAIAAITCPVLFVLGAQDQMTQSRAAQPLIALHRSYAPLRSAGADAAVPLPWFTVKGEAAYFNTTSPTADDVVLYVVQMERQSGELSLVGGYAGEVVTTRRSDFEFSPERGLTRAFLGRAAYTLDAAREVSVDIAVRQNGDGAWLKAVYSHARGAHWRATLGGAVIAGKASDFFGQYRRNSHLTATLRYSF